MREDDPADLDGDGEFDAIDMMIMEDEKTESDGKTGCSGGLLLLILVFSPLYVISRMIN
jgi:hypothetical protein